MRVKGIPVGKLKPEEVKSLKDDGVPESRILEYKSKLPGRSDGEKREFLKDVSAFANTEGGVIIYGIREKEGIPQSFVDLGELDIDSEQLRLENMVRDGLNPGLKGLAFQLLEVRGFRFLALGIPKSLSQPHMIWFKRDGTFWRRSSAGKYQMDVTELRQAFLESESWEKTAEHFRQRRTEIVRKGEFLPNLDLRGSFFLHLVPLGGPREYVDISAHVELFRKYEPPLLGGWNRFNLDGYLVYAEQEDKCVSYIQYFRRGSVEIYTSWLLKEVKESPVLSFSGNGVETVVVEYTEKVLNLYSELGVQPPIAVFLSVFDTMKSPIIHSEALIGPRHNAIDRPQLLLPPAVFEEDITRIDQTLRPILDMFWQAAGWKGSPNFTNDGIWKGRK
jgi:hypothetical protein